MEVGDEAVLERAAKLAMGQLEAAQLTCAIAVRMESEERIRDVSLRDRGR